MRNLAMALAVVGLLAGPALASQCPLLIKQVMDATAGKTDDASKKAQTLANEAKALHDLIVKRGGTILSPLADGPFGRFFVASDPDGYAITFHTARS